ncbi:hypothetical protein CDO87_19115 [Sagittula sp. P11]|nr:hypothetical protein CDO87_19115 [Sagittula sp. P11]
MAQTVAPADSRKLTRALYAPTGPKKTATLKHYPDAATTHAAHDGTETNKELDAATHAEALAPSPDQRPGRTLTELVAGSRNSGQEPAGSIHTPWSSNVGFWSMWTARCRRPG